MLLLGAVGARCPIACKPHLRVSSSVSDLQCKKKHTLVCPDFSRTGSCPRGASCRLQHRQPAKRRSAGPAARALARDARSREPASREPASRSGEQSRALVYRDFTSLECSHLSRLVSRMTEILMAKTRKLCNFNKAFLLVPLRQDPRAAPGTSARGPLELPSYISLCSSPEEGAALAQQEDTSRGKGRHPSPQAASGSLQDEFSSSFMGYFSFFCMETHGTFDPDPSRRGL